MALRLYGELAAIGWSHPTVTRTRSTGVAAGEEILHWLRETISGNVHKHP
ncbi:MAG: hypothetical protein ACRDRS_00745 [Pseudonocardiaceae bacterium]